MRCFGSVAVIRATATVTVWPDGFDGSRGTTRLAHSTALLFEHGDHRRVLFDLDGVCTAESTGLEAAPVVKRPAPPSIAAIPAVIAIRGRRRARVRPGKSRIAARLAVGRADPDFVFVPVGANTKPGFVTSPVGAKPKAAQALSAVNDIDRYGSQSGCTFPTATSTHVSACGA